MCFSLYLGIGCAGGGVSQGVGTQPTFTFFTLGSSKMEVLETYFFDVCAK